MFVVILLRPFRQMTWHKQRPLPPNCVLVTIFTSRLRIRNLEVHSTDQLTSWSKIFLAQVIKNFTVLYRVQKFPNWDFALRNSFMRVSCPVHLIFFEWIIYANSVLWTMQIMNRLLMKQPPVSCHFLTVRSKYFPRQPVHISLSLLSGTMFHNL